MYICRVRSAIVIGGAGGDGGAGGLISRALEQLSSTRSCTRHAFIIEISLKLFKSDIFKCMTLVQVPHNSTKHDIASIATRNYTASQKT